MSKKETAGIVVMTIFLVVFVALCIGGIVFGIHSFIKISKQKTEDKATLSAWSEVWESGEAVDGLVVRIKDRAARDNYEMRYAVDGTDYSQVCSINAKTFTAIDGEDKDGQGGVEIHYDPDDPQVAACEAAIEGLKEADKNASVGLMLLAVAFMILLYGVVKEVLIKVLVRMR